MIKRRTLRIYGSIFYVFFLYTGILIAGTTGKITGRVVDKNTKEPLPSVNVSIKGTSLGASTDIDGYYTILHVPPGEYTLAASYVGYATVTISNVRVRVDQTTVVDIEMEEQTIETAGVTVVAERNIVKKDVSTSVTSVQQDEIRSMPITALDNIVGLQAGVEEGLKIRGGEINQLLLQLDGATLRDPRNNQPITLLALSGIQEISIEKGGFNAEYGQVRSGIVNVIGREGDAKQYFASATVRYSPPTPKHFGVSVYDPNSMWNRPYLDPEVCWTGTDGEPFVDLDSNTVYTPGEPYTDVNNDGRWTGWDYYTKRQYPKFEGWNAISQALLQDSDPTNDLTPAAAQRVWQWERRRRPTKAPDYDIDAGFGGPIPYIGKSLGNLRFFTTYRFLREMLLIPLSRDDYREEAWSFKLNSDVASGVTLMMNVGAGRTYNVAINADDRQFNNPAWGINGVQFWDPTDYMRTPYQIAEITNEQRPSRIFTNSWYSEALVDHRTVSAKLTHALSPKTFYEIGFEHVHRKYKTGPIRRRNLAKVYEVVPWYFVDEAPFGWDPTPTSGLTGMFFGGHSATARDSSKVSSYLLKANITSQVSLEHLVKAGIEVTFYNLNLDYGLVNPFFSDVNYVKERWKPYQISAYIQDKIEAYGFVANIGLRMDVSNPNTEWYDIIENYDKDFYAYYDPAKNYPKKRVKSDISFSPRLGISHPITENSKLYFNYGHFKQMPEYEEIFRLGRDLLSRKIRNIGDPTLKQAKTISYELGYDQALFSMFLLQVAAFYNDITNEQSYTNYVSDYANYFKANNNSYRDIRGFEVTLRKSDGDWVRGFINYTYQVQTQGSFGKQTIYESISDQRDYDRNTQLAYQQKPTPQPRANCGLTIFTPNTLTPQLLLAGWSMNILAMWRAGEWINYNPKNAPEYGTIIQNVQTTDYYNVDMRINKTVSLNSVECTFFVDIKNLFNFKRLSGASFYDIHDQRYYLESLHLPKSTAYDNIPGNDRIGDVRKGGVPYQPIEQVTNVYSLSQRNIIPGTIYYDKSTKKYMEYDYTTKTWNEVNHARMKKILDDKAYIDMPNNSSFDFLNPRQVFFGVTVSVKF
ncbi:MAG: TonB-dependent receptor [Bacteroidetes bacterium]|nr:TonB-dependent receptor [Bacteroidota bacterium]